MIFVLKGFFFLIFGSFVRVATVMLLIGIWNEFTVDGKYPWRLVQLLLFVATCYVIGRIFS